MLQTLGRFDRVFFLFRSAVRCKLLMIFLKWQGHHTIRLKRFAVDMAAVSDSLKAMSPVHAC